LICFDCVSHKDTISYSVLKSCNAHRPEGLCEMRISIVKTFGTFFITSEINLALQTYGREFAIAIACSELLPSPPMA